MSLLSVSLSVWCGTGTHACIYVSICFYVNHALCWSLCVLFI